MNRPLIPAAPLVLLLLFCALPARSETQVPEFRLLELEAYFQNRTPDVSVPADRTHLFALAEARFDSGLSSAADAFGRLDRGRVSEPVDWLALVYRVKLADPGQRAALEERLKDALSQRGFFMVFDSARRWRWTSPLGHRFEFRETVDRLEISRNDAPFYALELA